MPSSYVTNAKVPTGAYTATVTAARSSAHSQAGGVNGRSPCDASDGALESGRRRRGRVTAAYSTRRADDERGGAARAAPPLLEKRPEAARPPGGNETMTSGYQVKRSPKLVMRPPASCDAFRSRAADVISQLR